MKPSILGITISEISLRLSHWLNYIYNWQWGSLVNKHDNNNNVPIICTRLAYFNHKYIFSDARCQIFKMLNVLQKWNTLKPKRTKRITKSQAKSTTKEIYLNDPILGFPYIKFTLLMTTPILQGKEFQNFVEHNSHTAFFSKAWAHFQYRKLGNFGFFF